MDDFLNGVWHTLQEYWLVISTVAVAFMMAVFRTAKVNGKVDWLEAGMCGIFAYGVWFVLGYFNFPEGAGVLIGGVIGYKGTAMVSSWLTNKLGLADNSDSEGK